MGTGGLWRWALAALLASPRDAAAAAPARARLELRDGPRELVTIQPSLHGLPLRGAYTSAWRDAAGVGHAVAARGPVHGPQRGPDEAALDEAEALAIVRSKLGVEPRDGARLVYLLVLERPVLAWEVALPLALTPSPSLRTVWVSATTGRLIHARDAAFASRARVFPRDPSSTPEPVEVELGGLAVTSAGQPLSAPGLEVRGCGSEAVDEPPAWWTEGACHPVARALSDAAGDYFVPLPDIGLVADNRAFDDAYAEVAAYHHIDHFFAVMRERGLATTRCDRFTVLVNRHTLDDAQQPSSLGGASYVDTCDPEASPTLLVGQGKDVDFAYDADVLYHEMGHSVVQQLTPDGLTDRRHAPWGIVSEAGAINEGVADYFAMTVPGDPLVAEYIGRFDVANPTPYLRTGESIAKCPDDLIGEWHSDGRIVGGALWALRARLGLVVDEMVLRALPQLPPDAVLDEFGAAVMAVAGQLADEGALDALGVALTQRVLASRGLLGCAHVIDDPELTGRGKKMQLVAADEGLIRYAPGPFQLRVQVPDDATEVTLFVTLAAEGEDTEAAASFLVKRADEPVAFRYALVGESGGDELEVVDVIGDHDVELEAESLNGEDFIARLPVEPGEVLHVALANRSPTKASASNFFVAPSTPQAAAPAAGCGCTTPRADGGWLVAVLALARRRRRAR